MLISYLCIHKHPRHRAPVQNSNRNDLLLRSSVKQLLGTKVHVDGSPHTLIHAQAQDLIPPIMLALIINYRRQFTSLFLVLGSFAACNAFLFQSCIRCPQWQKERQRTISQVRWDTCDEWTSADSAALAVCTMWLSDPQAWGGWITIRWTQVTSVTDKKHNSSLQESWNDQCLN